MFGCLGVRDDVEVAIHIEVGGHHGAGAGDQDPCALQALGAAADPAPRPGMMASGRGLEACCLSRHTQDEDCALNDISSCPRTRPHQLTTE